MSIKSYGRNWGCYIQISYEHSFNIMAEISKCEVIVIRSGDSDEPRPFSFNALFYLSRLAQRVAIIDAFATTRSMFHHCKSRHSPKERIRDGPNKSTHSCNRPFCDCREKSPAHQSMHLGTLVTARHVQMACKILLT